MPRHIFTGRDLKEIQQPLNYKTGYSNENFDKLYGKESNPCTGTERDSRRRKNINIPNNNSDAYGEGWDYVFNKK